MKGYKEYIEEILNRANVVVSEGTVKVDDKLKAKILKMMVKHGNNEKEAKQEIEKYAEKVLSIWKNTRTPAQFADKISWMAANDE